MAWASRKATVCRAMEAWNLIRPFAVSMKAESAPLRHNHRAITPPGMAAPASKEAMAPTAPARVRRQSAIRSGTGTSMKRSAVGLMVPPIPQ